MSKAGKKHRNALEALSNADISSWASGIDFVISNKYTKFDETVDADIVLGIDASKGEQTVRGSVLLPNGTGKSVRILVFAKGEHDEEARNAGADYVGSDDLVEKISSGWTDFDVAVATPDMMGVVGKVAKILGPKGLLPNKKVGTVTTDLTSIITDLKKGRVTYRNDKGGVVHAPFGKLSFGKEKLMENLKALVNSVKSNKPATAKGKFLKKLVISSTMGVGVNLNPEETI